MSSISNDAVHCADAYVQIDHNFPSILLNINQVHAIDYIAFHLRRLKANKCNVGQSIDAFCW